MALPEMAYYDIRWHFLEHANDMSHGDEPGTLVRPLLIAGVGSVLVAIAIGVSLLIVDGEGEPPAIRESAGPVMPAPGVAAPSPIEDDTIPGSVGAPPPSFDVVRINPRGDAVMAGRAAPGATVTIRDGDDVLGEATADVRGEWVFVPGRPLAPGSRRLLLDATGADGVRTESDSAVVLVVPEHGRDVTGRPGGGGSLAVAVPRDGQGPSRVLQTPAKGIEGPRGLALDVLDYDSSGHLAIGGRAKPRDTVRVYLDNEHLGDATADAAGRWSLTPDHVSRPGLYTLRADAVSETGQVLARVTTPFSHAEPLDLAPGDAFVVVQPGNSLWRLARRTYGSGFAYSLIFEANREQIGDPDLIYPGQVFALPVDAGSARVSGGAGR